MKISRKMMTVKPIAKIRLSSLFFVKFRMK